VSTVVEVPPTIVVNDAPKLLVEWSSPWEEFRSALRPALQRSPRRLAGEAHAGLFPYRGILITWSGEALLMFLLIWVPFKLASMRPYQPPPRPKYDVIYFSGDELPQTEDLGGAESGRSGRAGGREAYHRTQTIRVARGDLVRERVVDAPNLKLPHSDSAVQNLLAYARTPGPPPTEGMKSSARSLNALQTAIVAPPPEMPRDQAQAAPSLQTNVVAPSPSSPQRDLPSFDLPGSHAVQVVPPPVSAPIQPTDRQAQLSLPAPSVVAPPPTQIARQVSPYGPGFGPGDLQKQVVPPPVQLGNTAAARLDHGLGGAVAVVPPPADVSDASGQRNPVGGLGGGASVVPPPPSLTGGSAIGGLGRGNVGNGRGGPGELGEVAAAPTSGGNNNGSGVVVSNRPGPRVGIPGGGGSGALAMSPKGGADPGLGGAGGGSSIGRGTGPGSGFNGEGSGAGRSGVGAGSDPNARGGISPYPGPGGAGDSMSGRSAAPGVSIRGGTNVVNLPSFSSSADAPSTPGRSSVGTTEKGPDITIVASSRSGGAFNFYGVLKGDKVYTIYINTAFGPAVMQFADPTSEAHPYAEDLAGPKPLRADLPAGLERTPLVIACVLDRTGQLKNMQVLQAGSAMMTSKVLASLPRWKFRPAQRGTKPVEVNAIIGFNIDTSNKF
jgi:hypothetical protein